MHLPNLRRLSRFAFPSYRLNGNPEGHVPRLLDPIFLLHLVVLPFIRQTCFSPMWVSDFLQLSFIHVFLALFSIYHLLACALVPIAFLQNVHSLCMYNIYDCSKYPSFRLELTAEIFRSSVLYEEPFRPKRLSRKETFLSISNLRLYYK